MARHRRFFYWRPFGRKFGSQSQQALEGLASQIDPLRAEVELARVREAHFKEISEQHSFLPLAGRREFLRELTHILSHMAGLNAPVLIVLHLVNGVLL